MSFSTFSGPLRSGTIREGASANLGIVVLSQTALMAQNGTNVVDATFQLPANAQIVDFNFDVLTAFDSVTSATLSLGTASGGTQYASGVNVKAAAGRIAPTLTAAQLTNMSNITTNTSVRSKRVKNILMGESICINVAGAFVDAPVSTNLQGV